MSGDHRLRVDRKLVYVNLFTNVNEYVWTGPEK